MQGQRIIAANDRKGPSRTPKSAFFPGAPPVCFPVEGGGGSSSPILAHHQRHGVHGLHGCVAGWGDPAEIFSLPGTQICRPTAPQFCLRELTEPGTQSNALEHFLQTNSSHCFKRASFDKISRLIAILSARL